MRTITVREFGNRVRAIRRGRNIRQIDVARHAGVSRQWLVDLEHGKPTAELGLALRTLEALGMEIDMKLRDPPPDWTVEISRQAELKTFRIAARRRKRRIERRDAARAKRLVEAEAAMLRERAALEGSGMEEAPMSDILNPLASW